VHDSRIGIESFVQQNMMTFMVSRGVASPKCLGGKTFDFRGVTVFCLGYHLSKHKMTRYSKNLCGAMARRPPLRLWWSAIPTTGV